MRCCDNGSAIVISRYIISKDFLNCTKSYHTIQTCGGTDKDSIALSLPKRNFQQENLMPYELNRYLMNNNAEYYNRS